MTDDQNPQQLSDSEIIANTFQAIRVREMKKVEEVKTYMTESFPEVDEERRQACLVKLATLLVNANKDELTSSQRQAWNKRKPRQ